MWQPVGSRVCGKESEVMRSPYLEVDAVSERSFFKCMVCRHSYLPCFTLSGYLNEDRSRVSVRNTSQSRKYRIIRNRCFASEKFHLSVFNISQLSIIAEGMNIGSSVYKTVVSPKLFIKALAKQA